MVSVAIMSIASSFTLTDRVTELCYIVMRFIHQPTWFNIYNSHSEKSADARCKFPNAEIRLFD